MLVVAVATMFGCAARGDGVVGHIAEVGGSGSFRPLEAIPLPVPDDQRTLGTADPIRVIASANNGRWVVACQARLDTDGDGRTRVEVGTDSLEGDAMVPYLFRGGGGGESIDGLLAGSRDDRWLAILRDGALVATRARIAHARGMLVCKPPEPWTAASDATVVFLAGSIEMGRAVDWQAALTARIPPGVVVLNPRRDAWDAGWRQSIDEPRFRDQVEWELDGLDRADVIAMWFAPETRAPITLLELGLHARGGKLIVGCPEGYWRKGNVEIICARFGVTLAGDWDAFVAAVVGALGAARRDRSG